MIAKVTAKVSNLLLGCAGRLLLTALSADLLYLYYAGAWTDPIPLILVLEVALLWLLVVVGLLWTAHFSYCFYKEAK